MTIICAVFQKEGKYFRWRQELIMATMNRMDFLGRFFRVRFFILSGPGAFLVGRRSMIALISVGVVGRRGAGLIGGMKFERAS